MLGIYRKINPAINRSVYAAGSELMTFHIDGLNFGVLICFDSNFPDLARGLRARGAQLVFIPSNNGLPPDKADVVAASRQGDMQIAKDNAVWVVRSDVVGESEERIALGTTAITHPDGKTRIEAQASHEDIIVADLGMKNDAVQEIAEAVLHSYCTDY